MKIPKSAFDKLQVPQMLMLYNALMAALAQQAGKPVPTATAKFKDRTTAETRLDNLLHEFEDSTALQAVMTQLKFKPDLIAECCGLPAPTGKARKLTREQKAALKADAEMLKYSGALQAAMAKEDSPAEQLHKHQDLQAAHWEKQKDKKTKKKEAAAAPPRKPSGLGTKVNTKALTVAADPPSASPAVDRYQLIKQAEAEGRVAFNKLKLESGRYCMHKVYGVAKFRGTTRAEGVDVMMLEFANDIKVYVPFVCADLVQNIETKRKQIALGRIPKGQGKVPLQEQIDARLAKFAAKPARITTHAALVLAKIREMIPPTAEGDDVYKSSADVAKALSCSSLVVCRSFDRLNQLGLVKAEDDSPDNGHRFMYVYMTKAGYDFVIPSPEELAAKAPRGLPRDSTGPASPMAGKVIHKLRKDNPRRPGTHGHASFALIKEGMTYEAYKAAGGRNNDLQWDIDKGFVELRDKK